MNGYDRFRALIRWVVLVLLWLIAVCLILGSSRLMSIISYEPGPSLPPVITIDMKAKQDSFLWPFAPAGFAEATDHCNVLITNPCKSPYMPPYREGELVCPIYICPVLSLREKSAMLMCLISIHTKCCILSVDLDHNTP